MINYHILSLFFLIFFSFVFLYSDIKYKKIPNIVSLFGIIIFIVLAYFSGFFEYNFINFILRTIILFFIFYFLYLQWRVAGWDFKLYFIVTGFLMIFIGTVWNLKINWLYFDIYIISYSLFVGFMYLILRYFYLYVKWWLKLKVDEVIKIKLSNDRKDAILHFNIFIRSLVYSIFYIFLEKKIIASNTLLIMLILFEFTFIWLFLTWLKDTAFKYLDWFIRKKEVKFFCIFFFILVAIYLFYLKYFALVLLLVIFTFLDYIVAILQLNFDTKIIPIEKIKWDEKLSIRNFPISITKELTLSDEIELDENIIDYIQKNNYKYLEVITEVPYGVFLILWLFLYLYMNFN